MRLLIVVLGLLFSVAHGQEIECRADNKADGITSTCTGSDGFRSQLICKGQSCSYRSWFQPSPYEGQADVAGANEAAGYTFVGGKWVKCISYEGGKCPTIAYADKIEGCDKECTVVGNTPDVTCRKACIERVTKEQEHSRLEEQLSAACNQPCMMPIVKSPDLQCKTACETRVAKNLGFADADQWMQPTIDKRLIRESQKTSETAPNASK